MPLLLNLSRHKSSLGRLQRLLRRTDPINRHLHPSLRRRHPRLLTQLQRPDPILNRLHAADRSHFCPRHLISLLREPFNNRRVIVREFDDRVTLFDRRTLHDMPTSNPPINRCFDILLALFRRKRHHPAGASDVLLPRGDRQREGHDDHQSDENSRQDAGGARRVDGVHGQVTR